MAATIRDIAQRCGLSVSAVSKALNGYSDVSDATREAVRRAARELDYHPNAHARALKAGRSYNLGVLFSDDTQSGLTHPFFSVVLEHFKQEAEARGYDITFIGHRMGSGRVTYLDHCRYREVDGVCVACTDFTDEEVLRLVRSDIPLVTIDHGFDGKSCVFSDNEEGMRQLVRHVYGLGHRRVAYIHGNDSAVTRHRLKAFRETAEELGFTPPPEYCMQGKYTEPDTVYAAARVLLSLPQRPTCVLVCDDYAGLGVFRAAAECGLRIPEDLSVAGFDGISQMQSFYPRLTTVYQNAPLIGRESARLLISGIENEGGPRSVCIPVRLVPGETVTPPAGRASIVSSTAEDAV